MVFYFHAEKLFGLSDRCSIMKSRTHGKAAAVDSKLIGYSKSVLPCLGTPVSVTKREHVTGDPKMVD